MKKSILILLVLINGSIWGLSFVAMDYLMGSLDPMQVLAGRWLTAAVIFLAMNALGVIRIDLRKKSVKYLVLAALMQPCVYSVLEIYGIDLTSVTVSSIIIAAAPCMTLIVGMLFFHRRPRAVGTAGILTAFAGIVIANVFAPGSSAAGSIKGYLLLIAGIIILGFYAFVTGKAADDYGAMERTAVMSVFGAVTFNAVCLVRGFGAGTYALIFSDPKLIAGIVFLGLMCTVVSYSAYNTILAHMDPSVGTNLVGCITTTMGVVTGILIAGDVSGWYTWVGLVLTLAGVVLTSKGID